MCIYIYIFRHIAYVCTLHMYRLASCAVHLVLLKQNHLFEHQVSPSPPYLCKFGYFTKLIVHELVGLSPFLTSVWIGHDVDGRPDLSYLDQIRMSLW